LRNINDELNSQPLVRCPECGLRMPSNQVEIQRHFLKIHGITEQLTKREKDWKFQNVQAVKNPLSLSNIFGRA